MPLLPPRAPNGQTTWAASPMKIVRPTRKVVEQVVAVLVRADPDELELDVGAELLAQARAGDLGPADRFRVGVLVHLVVEAPDGVGHQVLPDGAALVERRVDPGPALDRERLLEADVADAPAVGVARRMRLEAERVADPAVGAGGVDEPVGLERVGAGRRLDLDDRAVAAVLDASDLALPADRLGRELADPLDQEPLEVELLQVDEGRLLGVALVLQVEGVDLVGAREGAADRPGDALGADLLVDAEPRRRSRGSFARSRCRATTRRERRRCRPRRGRRRATPRSARSQASVRPARPAPAMTTG